MCARAARPSRRLHSWLRSLLLLLGRRHRRRLLRSLPLLLASGFALGFFLLSAGPIGFQYGAEITRFLSGESTARRLHGKEIADKLGISYETVHTYIRRIYEKLQVRTRTEAVAKFLRR